MRSAELLDEGAVIVIGHRLRWCVLFSGTMGSIAPLASDELRTAHDGVEATSDLATVDLPAPSGSFKDDQSRSVALFAHGHLLKRHGQYVEALNAFQRAWFWHARHRKVLDEIVSLAFMLDQNELAVQYAVLAAEIEPKDPDLIRQLGDVLVQKGEYARAAALFRSALGILDGEAVGIEAAVEFDRDAVRFRTERLLATTCFLGDFAQEGVAASEAVIEGLRSQLDDSVDDALSESIRQELALFLSMLGELQRQSGAFDAARGTFEQARELDGDESTWRYWQAQLAYDQANVGGAREALDQYFELSPMEAGLSALELLGKVCEDDRSALYDRLEALLDQEPTDRALGYYLAERYLEDKKAAAARGILETLFNDRPTLDTYRGLLRCHRMIDDPTAAIALLGQLVETEGDFITVSEEVAQIVDDSTFVSHIVEAGLARRDDAARPLLAREAQAIALVLSTADDWDRADQFQQLACERAKPAAHMRFVTGWAIECLTHEQYARSVAHFQRALDSNVDGVFKAEQQFYLATALALDDHHVEAMRVIGEAVAAEPDSIAFASRRAWILRIAGRRDEALAAYEALVRRFTSSAFPRELQSAKVTLAALAADCGDVRLAEKHLVEIIANDPGNYGAMNDLGYLWADNRLRLARAEELIETAVANEPENAAYLDSQGWVRLKLGDVEGAIGSLERACSVTVRSDGVILDHLGDAYAAMSRMKEARTAWKASIEAFRQAEHLDKIKTIEEKIGRRDSQASRDTDQNN